MVNFILVLSVLVLFHELGHYLAARYFGVPVESFSIGFGPKLLSFKRAGTEFKVCALPLGGYVKMVGHSFAGDPSDTPGGYGSKPRWQRLVILFAGPFFNFLLAVIILTGVFMYKYERARYLDQVPTVGWVLPDSPAARAGVQPGDVVLSMDGVSASNWSELTLNAALAGGREVDLVLGRDGDKTTIRIHVPKPPFSLQELGWLPAHSARVDRLVQGLPASEAGIQAGDRVVSIDGIEIVAVEQISAVVGESGGRPVRFELERAGSLREVAVTPKLRDGRLQVGIMVRAEFESAISRLPLPAAVEKSIQENVMFAGAVFRAVTGLVVGEQEITSLAGPVGIYEYTQTAASYGLIVLLEFAALVSVNLGVVNLAPVPVLDGGQILLLLVELLLRRDLSEVVKMRITQAGLLFIVVLFGVVMYNDVSRQLFGP